MVRLVRILALFYLLRRKDAHEIIAFVECFESQVLHPFWWLECRE